MGFSAPPDPPVAAPTKPACCRRAKWLFPLALALIASFFLLHGPHGCHHRHRFVPHPLPPAAEGGAADTCDRLDCPPFKLAHQESDFEIRRYRAALWAETGDLLDASFDKATKRGFRRLFEYIQGRNKEEVHIPMTAPVLTSIKPSGGPFCSSSFTVKFFVPPSFSEKPPTPGEGLDVHIANLSARCVAVRRFSGFATDFNVAQEAKLLADSLERTEWANITTRSGGGGEGGKGEKWEVYSIAQYNSPFELFNRVNEVWVPFEGTGEEGDECKPATAVSASESSQDGASAGIIMATARAV